MSALTDPYVPDVALRLVEGVRPVHRVIAYRPTFGVELGHELALSTGTLTIDEDAAQRFTLNASIGLGDQQLLDFLDPRTGTRLEVWAGYEYADRTLDVHRLVDLGLRERVVRRPQNDVVLLAVSDEALVQDHTPTAPITLPLSMTVTAALSQLLSLGHAQPVTVALSRGGTLLGTTLVVRPDGVWSAVHDLLDRVGGVAYHDGTSGFWAVDQPEAVGAAAYMLRTGPAGTLTSTEVALDLTSFANLVIVEFMWRDVAGVEHTERGWAEDRHGPHGTVTTGARRGRVVTRTVPGTVPLAQAEAASILRRTLSRGRRVHVEGAVAAFWLRPEHTVTIQLPIGDAERALVTQVALDLPTGTMSIHTRQPETVTIHTGA